VSSMPEIQKENDSSSYREERFRLLVDAISDYAIFLLDPEGRILTWNTGAESIKGYKAAEVIGRNFSIFYSHEDIRSGKPRLQLETARLEGRSEDEGWRVRKDGSRFWANTVLTSLRDESDRIYGFAKVTRDMSRLKRSEDALRLSLEQLRAEIEQRNEAERAVRESEASVRDLSARLLRLQDEERRRLGRELHDTVGQLLVGIKLALGALHAQAQAGDFTRRFAECNDLLDAAMREVRTMSYLLYPPMLEETGLRATAEWYIEGFRQRSGIAVQFEAVHNFLRMPRDSEVVLFRILQESLTNVHRHSGSRTAQVRLKTEDQRAILEVEDQGKGAFTSVLDSEESALGSLGVGLRGMKERVHQLGGTLEFISSESGTIVRASLPV
jgi:PAS domain S-box-containing protein